MMQMEWCNQFDSGTGIHRRGREEEMKEDPSTVLLLRFKAAA